jgi:hypothetical protein
MASLHVVGASDLGKIDRRLTPRSVCADIRLVASAGCGHDRRSLPPKGLTSHGTREWDVRVPRDGPSATTGEFVWTNWAWACAGSVGTLGLDVRVVGSSVIDGGVRELLRGR